MSTVRVRCPRCLEDVHAVPLCEICGEKILFDVHRRATCSAECWKELNRRKNVNRVKAWREKRQAGDVED